MRNINAAPRASRQTLLAACPGASQAAWGYMLGSEHERRYQAAILHDSPIQTLIGLSYHLADQARRQATPSAEADSAWLKSLSQIRLEVLAVVEQLRRYASQLDPAGLGQVDLATALRRYGERLEAFNPPVVELHGFEAGQKLPEAAAIGLFRVSQEALHNAVQHAQANWVRLELHVEPTQVDLRISDDGGGLTLPLDPAALRARNRMGFFLMTTWLGWLGGGLTVIATPGDGTRLEISLPLASNDE